jgi:3-hydroxybutyryl-CoA dehydrogenase
MAEKVESIEQYALKQKELSKTQFAKIGLVGSGPVGQGIARMASKRGMEVFFIGDTERVIKNVMTDIDKILSKTIDRWGMTKAEKTAIINRINGSTDWESLNGCDIIIEATESSLSREEAVKRRKKLFKKIEKHVDVNTIITTNTTTLMVTELISVLEHPERGISLHFLSPAVEAPLVEVVRGLHTSDEVYNDVIKFAKLLGKEAIPVLDFCGKISTRMIIPLINEACKIQMEGAGSMHDIDKIMRVGFHMQNGPFEMADMIGLDNLLRWMDNLYDEFGDQKYKASPTIKKLVRANCLGRKNGNGFYKYDKEGKKIVSGQ